MWLSIRIVSTIPCEVSGLTKHEAPSAAVVPSGSRRQTFALSVRYCVYMAPPRTATVRPSKACASSDSPAATTTPAPSLPTGIDWPNRLAMPGIRSAGMLAVMAGLPGLPDDRAVAMSAAPKSRPRSEGFSGAPSMRTTTSSGFGAGTGMRASETSSSPESRTSECSCSVVLMSMALCSSVLIG